MMIGNIHILLVEDNEGDVVLTTETLEEGKIGQRLTVIKNGEGAIQYFERLTEKSEIPDLVLLDINLPKKSGHEVLQYIRKNEKYQNTPVVMLTTSSAERDMLASYKYYANGYLVKPIGITEFLEVITGICGADNQASELIN
ncbi:MAG: response regulator [Mucilaginibacter sp.]